MGMFDTITCEAPLPGPASSDFQTKSLECEMAAYRIDADGQLWEDGAGFCRRDEGVPAVPRPLSMTGEIRFYGRTKQYPEVGEFVKYSAYFVKGKLKELHQIKPEPA